VKKKIRSDTIVFSDIILLSGAFLLYLIYFYLEVASIIQEWFVGLLFILVVSIADQCIIFIFLRLYNRLQEYTDVYKLFTVIMGVNILNGAIFTYNSFINRIIHPSNFMIVFLLGICFISGTSLLYCIYRRLSCQKYLSCNKLKHIPTIGVEEVQISIVRQCLVTLSF